MPDMFEQLSLEVAGCQEFLEVKWIHVNLAEISDRSRSQILEFHAKKGSGKYILVAAIIDKELYVGDNLRTFLDFVKEYQGVSPFK